jgi:hypothetical protein
MTGNTMQAFYMILIATVIPGQGGEADRRTGIQETCAAKGRSYYAGSPPPLRAEEALHCAGMTMWV